MLLPVVMEQAMCDQRRWVGPVGGALNERMYADCSVEGREHEGIPVIMRELAGMDVFPRVGAAAGALGAAAGAGGVGGVGAAAGVAGAGAVGAGAAGACAAPAAVGTGAP